MLWFKHPKPFNQRPVVTQVVASKAQTLPAMRVIVMEAAPKKSDASAATAQAQTSQKGE